MSFCPCPFRALKVTPLLAHQAPRGHLVPQEEAMMGDLDNQGHLDLQDHLYQGLTEAHIVSYIHTDKFMIVSVFGLI